MKYDIDDIEEQKLIEWREKREREFAESMQRIAYKLRELL